MIYLNTNYKKRPLETKSNRDCKLRCYGNKDILVQNKREVKVLKTNESINEKLKYIGLDLNNIPERLVRDATVNFRLKRNYDERNYKVYKYVNVNDISILLTPTHRLADYTEKYAKALPLYMYLNPVNEEDMDRYNNFLGLVNALQIEDLKAIEEQQKQFKKSIPDGVKYKKDYMWQIYYAEDVGKYFILFPTKENEVATLFYILKKQFENKNEKIYVPICYATYSHEYLYDSEISDLENYLCFFTKEWPLIHEVFDIDEKLSMQILGRTFIYDTIKSEYKIVLRNPEEARNFYQLLKALFILETQLSHHYKFKIKLNNSGNLLFYNNNEEITFEKLPEMIRKEYFQGLENITKTKEIKVKLIQELKRLKKQAYNFDSEYYEKEKQITIFAECKKTFFGRLRYFLKYKKVDTLKQLETSELTKEEIQRPKGKLKYFEKLEIKEHYNLENLIELYENLDAEYNEIRNLEQDIDAMNKRIDMLKMKINNADEYIKNIDAHKKSIFEFWRFTKKEEIKLLSEGTTFVEEKKKNKIKKTFNFDTDFEDIGKQFDLAERNLLNKQETDCVYIATTKILEDINLVLNKQKIPIEHLENLKKELKEENKGKKIDIFGSIMESQEKIKTLGNIRHRENEKNIFPILLIKEDTTLEEYSNILEGVIETINRAMKKFEIIIDIPVYMVGNLEDDFKVFYINPEEALEKARNTETNLYKINLLEGTKAIPLSNIMYYNNDNQTLPLGMNITSGILLNLKKLKLKNMGSDENYKLEFKTEKIRALKLNIFEYGV